MNVNGAFFTPHCTADSCAKKWNKIKTLCYYLTLIMAKCVNCLLCKFELHMNIGSLNLQSARKKSTYIRGKIEKEKTDFFCGSETWHCQSDEPSLVRATPPDYDYVEDYNDNCYGGVVIFHRRSHNTYKLNLPQYNTLQCVGIEPYQLERFCSGMHLPSTSRWRNRRIFRRHDQLIYVREAAVKIYHSHR